MRLFSFKSLIYFTFILSLCVIALGAYTRLTEAGLGCPDWPGCYGFISVPQSAEQQLAAQQTFPLRRSRLKKPGMKWCTVILRVA